MTVNQPKSIAGDEHWIVAANYPDPKTASNRRFAWEFLRRNAEYRRDWQRYVEACEVGVKRQPEIAPFVEFLLSAGKHDFYKTHSTQEAAHLAGMLHDLEEMQVYTPERRPGESEGEWLERLGEGVTATITPLACHLGRKWGLRRIANPATSRADFAITPVTIMGPGFPLAKEMEGNRARRLRSETHCGLWIDLRLPIEKLQMKVMATIKTERASRIKDGTLEPIANRFSRDKLRTYLQVLDGESSGATVLGVAGVLVRKKRVAYAKDTNGAATVRNWLKEAKRIRDRDYLALAMGNDPIMDMREAAGAHEWLREVERKARDSQVVSLT